MARRDLESPIDTILAGSYPVNRLQTIVRLLAGREEHQTSAVKTTCRNASS